MKHYHFGGKQDQGLRNVWMDGWMGEWAGGRRVRVRGEYRFSSLMK